MAQNTTIQLTAGSWTQLTDADVSLVRFLNVSSYHMLIKGTNGATAPTDALGALRYNPGQGEATVRLDELFPGVAGVNRLYAYSDDGVSVSVSHA